jgi:hypothetical protein
MNFMKAIFLFWIFWFISCASPKEVVQGYSGTTLEQALTQIHFKSPGQIIKILGKPIIMGECSTCDSRQVFRMIYPARDMTRFHLEVTMNTDQSMECVIFDLVANKKLKRYIFDKDTSLKFASNCNQNSGAIGLLKSVLDNPKPKIDSTQSKR